MTSRRAGRRTDMASEFESKREKPNRIPTRMAFAPLPDITTIELAEIMAAAQMRMPKDFVDVMTPEAKRHFVEDKAYGS